MTDKSEFEKSAGIAAMQRLKEIVDQLRSPGGCPWDQEQTSSSLKSYLLEEAHEVAQAIDEGNSDALREELGDLMLNVFLQVRIAEEQKEFDLKSVADGISDKLIRRHPHVFGEHDAQDSQSVRKKWEEIKAQEKASKGQEPQEGLLRELPAAMPLLLQAIRIGDMAAELGFDWPDMSGPLDKVHEELEEIKKVLQPSAAPNEKVAPEYSAARLDHKQKQELEGEIGDLLFAVSSLCRKSKIDPEAALRGSLGRFRDRFAFVEEACNHQRDRPLVELEAHWQRAKKIQSEADN